MAPNRETTITTRLSMNSLQRTVSDISQQLTQETLSTVETKQETVMPLPPISEVENAKCECCGMFEECTPEYIRQVRSKFSGKLICGLCAEAVNQEMEKNNRMSKEDAVQTHVNACVRFNKIGRTHPVLYQAEDMKSILKKSSRKKTRSMGPKERKGGLARSSSCMPSITKEIGDQALVN